MATKKQRKAARRNIKKAATAAQGKRSIAHLPPSVRKDLGRQAAKSRARRGKPGKSLEDRTRTQLYKRAQALGIPGRSQMGKWDLVKAIRKAA